MFGKKKSSILEVMKQFFEEDEWHYAQIEDKPVLRMGFKGKHISMQCYAKADEEMEQFLFYSVLENHASEDKLGEMAEFIRSPFPRTVVPGEAR